MYTIKRDKILEALGWLVVCESPLEIENEETNSSANGWAAEIVIDELVENWKDYLDDEDIPDLDKWLENN